MKHRLGLMLLLALFMTATLVPLTTTAGAQEKPKPTALSPQEVADGWISLFDGETLFGWKIDGEAKIAGGLLELGGEKETTATTTTQFSNSKVQFDYRMAAYKKADFVLEGAKESLSGLMTRTACEVAIQGNKIVEFMTKASLGGGLEAKSLLLAPEGPSRTTIGFRVPAGTKLTLYPIKLKPLGLNPVFNGKDLTGWKALPGKDHKSTFSVTPQGELAIKNGKGDLQTEGQWDDFVLQLDVRTNGKHLNSGVFFRCLPGEVWSGYESQIRNQWEGNDRTKPVDFGTGAIYRRQPARKVVSNDNEWFTKAIVAHGNHMAVWVDGYQVTDFTDTRPANRSARQGTKVDKGPISLQGHDPTTDLSFRNIRIAELAR